MIDIHSHILPGIDDGAESVEDALAMAELAASSGVTVLAATPHSNQRGRFVNYESLSLQDLFYDLRAAIRKAQIPLRLVRGMEIYASDDVARRIATGQLLPLNDSRYYLVEFAFDEEEWYIRDILSDILGLGKVPVVAHPERYHCVQEDPNHLFQWRQMGALAQLNKGSVFGKFGARPKRAAEVLLNHGLVNCVASDAHRPYARTTDMSEIDSYLDLHFPPEYRDLLLEVNPGRILDNRPVPMEPRPLPVEARRRWF